MSLSGLELIKAYRENPERYLPMMDHTWEMPAVNEYGEVNICWAVDHVTTLTIYVSAKGIEDKSAEELDQWFQDIGYFSYRDQEHDPADVQTFGNPADGEFFMLTIGVGIDGEPALIDGAPIEPWSVLNEYNRETLG